MEQVSNSLNAFFIVITLMTIYLFYKAANQSKTFLNIALVWMSIQAFVSNSGFYENTTTIPPRFIFLVLPPLIFIVILFVTSAGRRFIDDLNVKYLTILHTVRIFVELALYFLFLAKTIPKIMTFEGHNFDILAGLSAPIIYYFMFVKKSLNYTSLLIWNLFCLGLLVNIVVIAILSVKTSFQQFGFEQPNIAIAHLPYIWLPSVIVPLVLFSHLAVIRKLTLSPQIV